MTNDLLAITRHFLAYLDGRVSRPPVAPPVRPARFTYVATGRRRYRLRSSASQLSRERAES